ncbi:MAG: tetratricopeptide repeat protein [Sandaracinaceae bacterium]|nr:tetratricopeptide repeat protein [Sandaracinaceae bacterium]
MRTSRTFVALSATLALAGGWAGCGGGGGEGGGGGATDEHGNVIRTAGGSAVSEEAHNHWTEAIAMFERNEAAANGWTPANCQAAQSKFEEANNAQGGSFTEAIYMMGVVSGRCGDDEAALGHYRRALETNERYCGARVGVGLGDMRAGRTAQAREHFERSIRDDNQCTSGYVNLAIIQRQTPAEVREALNNLRRALAIESDYLPAFNQMALLYLSQAAENQRQMLDLAEVVCRQAQLINPNYAPIYNTWGLINVRQGNIIAALAKFERAFNLDGDFFEAYMNFGSLTLSFRGYEDATRAFTQARRLRAQDYDATIGLGAAQRGLTQVAEAEATYRAAIQIDAQRPEAYFNLGLLYQDFKGGAVADLRQATGFYEQFTQRAGNRPAMAETVEAVTRRCRRRPQTGSRRRREGQSEWVGDCRPGRVQQIELAIALQEEMQQMQQQMQQQGGGGGGGEGEGGGDGG